MSCTTLLQFQMDWNVIGSTVTQPHVNRRWFEYYLLNYLCAKWIVRHSASIPQKCLALQSGGLTSAICFIRLLMIFWAMVFVIMSIFVLFSLNEQVKKNSVFLVVVVILVFRKKMPDTLCSCFFPHSSSPNEQWIHLVKNIQRLSCGLLWAPNHSPSEQTSTAT